MKRLCLLFVMLLWVMGRKAPAQRARESTTPVSSPTDSRIAGDKRQIQQTPARFQPYNDLALALIARFRETGDPSSCVEAGEVLQAALRLAPGNMQVLKTQVALRLARHEFAQAHSEARSLNAKMPDDVSLYGYLAEADIELGNYAEAEREAQWMLNLLPNNVPGLLIGARLRELFGDPEGALEFLNQAYAATPPSEIQELAAIGDRIARVQMDSGRSKIAGQVLEQVLQLYPAYPAALEDMARLKAADGKYDEAAELFRALNQRRSSPQVLYALARVLARGGRTDQSKPVYADFERTARMQVAETHNANRELVLYYADGGPPDEALNIARREVKTRQDVFTLDAYAWALYASGQYEEARKQIEKALKVGVRDAGIFYHAAAIAAKQNDRSASAQYCKDLLETNPWSEFASDARRSLGAISGPTAGGSAISSLNSKVGPAEQVSPAAVLPSATPDLPTTLPGNLQKPAATTIDDASSFQPIPQRFLTPKPAETDRVIRSLQSRITREPNQHALYAELGAAFFQKARETGDVSDFDLAEQALEKSLDLVSNDLAAAAPEVTLAAVYMGEHRFADALVHAEKSLALGSGDLSPLAIVGDAYADMGEYDKAMDAYTKLQTSNGGYVRDSRVSFLKFVAGDTDAAIQLMRHAIANAATAQLPSENLAWLYYELGEYCVQSGNPVEADRAYLTALRIHPGDYRALAALARLRATQGMNRDAIQLYQSALAVVPMPLFAAELGDLYAKVGRPEDARKQFQLVEYMGKLGAINQVLHNRDLALFYADHEINLKQAVDLAQKEFEVRHDIYTWDVLAWALYKNKRPAEAAEAIAKALQFNTKDALLLFHGGMIYRALGQESKAREFLTRALTINPHFHIVYADIAVQQLAELNHSSSQPKNARSNHVQ